MTSSLKLAFSLTFHDLYTTEGLERLHNIFLSYLGETDPELKQAYQLAVANTEILSAKDESNLIVQLAPIVEDFIGKLFSITSDVHRLQNEHSELSPLFSVKRLFVQRVALKKYPVDICVNFNSKELLNQLNIADFTELRFAKQISEWLVDEEKYQDQLDLAARYTAWATLTPAGKKQHQDSVLFKTPHKTDLLNLIPSIENINGCGWQLPESERRLRQGFSLTDEGLSRAQALGEANYCIWCHHQGKDSCSKGLKPKPTEETSDRFVKNAFGTNLTGCPLEEKISEMNEVKAKGNPLGALAIITIDNPMVAATGHRICNDCMKSCIFQKQEPVNIPGIETQILKDVLNLPWGFEIYSLLTRWNPLNLRRPKPLPDSGYKVLVAGMGPAGFTLAHHLMNDGHTVVGIDGLKIEPLPADISGASFNPVKRVEDLYESLDDRITGGFGGVAEYGITVRWNKNFLKLIRLLLERRSQFLLFGGVRMGGTITIDQAFQELNFDHVALCLGAGSPTLIPIKNSLAPGVRQASDFLMALQLTGAAKKDSIANLQIKLPILVIGGGLTAIDTATESMAYYPVQVEKFSMRYNLLIKTHGEKNTRQGWSESEAKLADEMLAHSDAFQKERQLAAEEGRAPNFQKLIDQWGGVTVVYRRSFTEAPSYTLNHEEVLKALEEGIRILDNSIPIEVEIDDEKQACGLKISHNGTEEILKARTILIAAGTKPNINLRYDEPVNLDGLTFQAIDEFGDPITPERLPKPRQPHILMRLDASRGTSVSFLGDMHPSFAGNVVKAMGSAKQGYPIITRTLKKHPAKDINNKAFFENLQLHATVESVNRLTSTIVEVVVKAPLAARAFKPGQFYRLQNFESDSKFAMEGLALTGASVDHEKGLLSTIVLEMGGSSNLCKTLVPGQSIILMGPTGTPTEITKNETVLLAGGGLGNAVLFSIGQALRANGCRVLYFAGYKKCEDRYKIDQIEAAADQIIWCCDEEPGFTPTRSQDLAYVGNIVKAMQEFAEGNLGEQQITLSQVHRMIVIGSDRMMAAVGYARHHVLKSYLNPNHLAVGSINSPMQCMMKEICAQCLQMHTDPVTGHQKIVYSCVNQDQLLDQVDFSCLSERLSQNSLQEKLTNLWVNKSTDS